MTGIETALIVAAVASAVVGGVGAYASASAAKKGAEYEAEVADRNSKLARQQAGVDAQDARRDARRRIGALRASYGATGFSLAGSPLDVLEDQAAEFELDAQRVEYGGEMRAVGQIDQARARRAEAKAYGTSATISAIGTPLAAASAGGGAAAGMGLI